MTGRRDYIIVAVVLAIGWAVWLQRMGINDHDDMLSHELIFAREGVATLVTQIPWPDQSPLYFLYLHALRIAGESPFVLQFGNAVLLSLALAGTYLLARAFSASRTVAAAAVVFGVISPTSVWLVRNGRMYSLQLLCAVAATLFVLRYLERRRTRDLAAFCAVSLANIYIHFFGFLITGLLFVPLLADVWLGTPHPENQRPTGAWRSLRALVVAALCVLVASLPQVVRIVALVTQAAPAARADVSLPAPLPQFLERVSWFWFVNADWGMLRVGEPLVTAIYVGSIVALAAVGLATARRRLGVAAAVGILLPLAVFGLAASRLDVRDRYFVWTLPLLWIAVAMGGVAPLPARWLQGTGADIVRGMRAALVVIVAAGSMWLLWHKLPERYAEWTKLMTTVEQLLRPSMVVYMPPGSPIGSPRHVATDLQLPAALRDVRELSSGTHDRFLSEVDDGREFVFLVYGGLENDELRRRVVHLEERGYHKAVVPVYAARAYVFTRDELGVWSPAEAVGPGAPTGTIVDWARQQLRHRPLASEAAPPLAEAVAARVSADGTARIGRVFSSQRGEYGGWKLGPQEWDAVEVVRTTSGGVERVMVGAHPASGSVLVVATPALKLQKSLDLIYGIGDTGLAFGAGAAVDIEVYVNGQATIRLSCPNTPGWKTATVDTSALDGTTADVVMLVTTRDDSARHFAYRLEPSSRAERPARVDPAPAPLVLTRGRKLSDAVEQLRVYRREGDRRIDATADGRTYSATDMHEAAASAGGGSVHRVWAVGPLLWDSVGSTRQRSGGVERKGMWAHPRNGSTLVIEASRVTTNALLRGYVGFTDVAVDTARRSGIDAPVTFRVSVDGRVVFERDVARTAGWSEFAVPGGTSSGSRDVRIEIHSAVDSWAHFIFDLWTE